MAVNQKLADLMRGARVGKGVSMTEAARDLGVSRQGYRLWELGVSQPDSRYWTPLAGFAGVTVPHLMELLGVDPEVAPPTDPSRQEQFAFSVLERLVTLVADSLDSYGALYAEEEKTLRRLSKRLSEGMVVSSKA